MVHTYDPLDSNIPRDSTNPPASRADNDMFHHLNNPIYGVLIDSIINEYLITHLNYNTTTYPRTALVANTYCDYFGQLQYPGVMELGLRVVKLGRNSVMWEVGFFKEGEEGVKAVGGVCADLGGEGVREGAGGRIGGGREEEA